MGSKKHSSKILKEARQAAERAAKGVDVPWSRAEAAMATPVSATDPIKRAAGEARAAIQFEAASNEAWQREVCEADFLAVIQGEGD